MPFHHVPVLPQEVIHYLDCKPGGIYVDCTLGGGGHTEEILNRVGPEGKVVAIDRDREAIAATKDLSKRFPTSLLLVHDNFKNLPAIISRMHFSLVDGILFDLGPSSHQLDMVERGFTYSEDAPLDMRMDQGQNRTAEKLVNELSQKELARLISHFGEERWAGRIAQFIVSERAKEPIRTTGRLVEIIKKAIPARARRTGPHPAKRTFQALRIAVNDELSSLGDVLQKAINLLKPGGRLVAISFHSLEDRIVKMEMREAARACVCPPESPVCTCRGRPLVRILTKKPVTPKQAEIEENPRARSAKLRACERLGNVLSEERSE